MCRGACPLSSPYSTTSYCAYNQASVWNHILLESIAKFSTGQVHVRKRGPQLQPELRPAWWLCLASACWNILTLHFCYKLFKTNKET